MWQGLTYPAGGNERHLTSILDMPLAFTETDFGAEKSASQVELT
jgi:hypothetical protein